MTGEAVPGWAFLVARGHKTGYQLLLAPHFTLTSGESALLMDEVRGEVPMQDPPVVLDIVAPASGPLCVVYRTIRATRGDVGETERPGEPLLDRAGRPLVLAYGFICRGARVIAPHEQDLCVARNAAVATYRRFRAAEETFPAETSRSYSVRSAVAPAAVAPAEAARLGLAAVQPAGPAGGAPAEPEFSWPASELPAPWTSETLPSSEQSAPVRRRPAIVLSLVAVLALLGVALGARAFSHGPQSHARVQIQVPDVVGRDKAVAVRQIQKARLVPEIEFAPSKWPSGTVVQTRPRAGARVGSHSVVRVEVSRGGSRRPLAKQQISR